MSKSPRLLAVTGVACFVVFLVAFTPARVLTGFVDGEAIRFVGVTGTVWSGEARHVLALGLQFDRTAWALRPLGLFVGRLTVSIETGWSGGFVRGDVAVGVNGSVRLREFKATGPIEPIARRMRLPAAGGNFAAEVAKLDLVNGWPDSAVGEIRVGDVPLSVVGVSSGWSGSYALRFDTETVPEDGRFSGELVYLGGPVAVAGSVALNPPGNYELVARLKARSDAPPELEQGLKLLGPADADGNRELRLSGSL